MTRRNFFSLCARAAVAMLAPAALTMGIPKAPKLWGFLRYSPTHDCWILEKATLTELEASKLFVELAWRSLPLSRRAAR